MSDSFFGFNTTLPGDEDGGLRGPDDDEDSELEYDALNDETFGAAMKGDWEDLHENLVQLERTGGDELGDDDDKDAFPNDFHSLEQDLLRLGLKNMPSANYDDFESRINLDPSVWAPPTNLPAPPMPRGMPNSGPGHGSGGNLFGVPLPQDPAVLHSQQQQPFPGLFPPPPQTGGMFGGGGGGGGPKIMTLEDIERSMRSQPATGQSNGHPQLNSSSSSTTIDGFPGSTGTGAANSNNISVPSRLPPGFGPQQQPPQPNNGFPSFPRGVPPMMMPPPPHSGGGPPSPNHLNKQLVMEIQQTHPLLAYNRMNAQGPPPPGPPGAVPAWAKLPPGHHHPMFPGGPPPPIGPPGSGRPMYPHHPPPYGMPPPPPHGHHPHHPHHMHHQQQQMQMMHQQHQNNNMKGRHSGGGQFSPRERDGNVSLTQGAENQQPRDEYRNLMTPRDKQWLIGIQLLQLNTETPYIDDYYYAVYKERKLQGRRENRCHTDNQLNHPLTQPQGHAQLVLQSIGRHNGNDLHNHHHHRNRKNSESSKGGEDQQQQQQNTPRTYTPLQFENSLGKLQCGSVTAPRKVIDMEIMAAEQGSGGTGTAGVGGAEASAQRKCRQMLFHIETLYKVVLKLEDLQNPTAIEAYARLREKRKAQLEQQERDSNSAAVTAAGGGRLNIDSTAEDKSKLGEETREELLKLLVAGLALEKVIGMMAVRKGRTLLQRAVTQLEVVTAPVTVWQTWVAVLAAVPLALKKDREDTDVQLVTFLPVFRKHLASADLKQLHSLALAIEPKAQLVMATKFGVGCLLSLFCRAEDVFVTAKDTINMSERREWNVLLSGLCTAAVAVMEDTGKEEPTVVSIKHQALVKKTISHLLRFPDLIKTATLINALCRHEMGALATGEDLAWE